MNQILSSVFAVFVLSATAQTPLIAHKSHSGASISYFIDPFTNFGAIKIDLQPEPLINQTFKPINDSVIVREVLDYEGQIIQRDTLQNKQHRSPALFQVIYQDSIRKKATEENYKRELEQEEQFKKQQLESQEQLNEPAPAKKKKKSYLLFLFGITGGGMLLMKLFGRSKGIHPSISQL
jgi:hypothetical protein